MVTLQWASKVERREEREEGSAWTLCSGRPLSTADAVRLGAERESYTGRAGAPATHYFLPYEKIIRVPFVSIRGSIIPHFRVFRVFRGSFPPQRTRGGSDARARQPRTTFFSLLPSPYFTENKRVVPSSVSCRISRASRSLIESSSSWYWVFSGGVKDSSAKRSLPFRSAIPSLSAGRSSR